MRNIKGVLSILALVLTLIMITGHASAYVPEEGKVSATLGPYVNKTDFRNAGGNMDAPLLGGLGLIVQGDASTTGGLEVAMFFTNKLYLRELGPLVMAEQTQLVHITMGYRWWLTSMFSASLSLYSAYSMSEPLVVRDDFAPKKPIDTSARDVTEYGFDWSLQTEVWARDRESVVLDARYSSSVTGKDNEEANHYAVFVGYRYLVQEKGEAPKSKKP